MYQIKCDEVWGGVRNQDQDVCTSGVTASLYSSSCDGGKGGDVYYFSVCQGDRLTRIAVADVVGHGQAVSNVSTWLYDILKTRMNSPDGTAVLADLNHLVIQHGQDAITTAAVVAFHKENSNLYFSYAGHHPALLRRRNDTHWWPAQISAPSAKLANLPLGVVADTHYDQQEAALRSGDRLFLYTDGVVEAPDPRKQLFGHDRLLAVLDHAPDQSLMELKTAVLRALRKHTGGPLHHDDVTLLAIEVR